MAWREVIYEYDGSFDGLLCCIFESYTQKELPAAIVRSGECEPTFYEVRAIRTVDAHARRVERSFARYPRDVGRFLRHAFLTCLPEKELAIYRFAARLYAEGAPLLSRLSDETCYPLLRAVRSLHGEVEQYRGFVRFSDFGGVLAAEIEPKNRVLPLLRGHFCARCHDETFFLYDRTHGEALLHTPARTELVPLDSFTMAPPDAAEAEYRRLWRRFYDTIAIRERENPRLRMTHMPKRFWAMMTEFQDEAVNEAPRGAFPAHGAPAAIPAPARRAGCEPSAPA